MSTCGISALVFIYPRMHQLSRGVTSNTNHHHTSSKHRSLCFQRKVLQEMPMAVLMCRYYRPLPKASHAGQSLEDRRPTDLTVEWRIAPERLWNTFSSPSGKENTQKDIWEQSWRTVEVRSSENGSSETRLDENWCLSSSQGFKPLRGHYNTR